MSRVPLLPSRFRWLGSALLLLGLALGVARFRFGFRPAFLHVKLFALYSAFFETKSFTLIEKNATDEVAALLLLAGLFAVAFSRERREDASLDALRLRALFAAVAADCLLLALSLFLVFGVGFVLVLATNMFATLTLYVIIFRCLLAARAVRARRHGFLDTKPDRRSETSACTS